jgi:hypothetical protein
VDPDACQNISLTFDALVWFKIDEKDHPEMPIPDDLRDRELYLFAFEDHSLGHRLLWASKGENGTSKSPLVSPLPYS